MVHPLKMVSASNPVGYQIIRPSFGVVMLKKMGYRNAFNLGSYRRAEKILTH